MWERVEFPNSPFQGTGGIFETRCRKCHLLSQICFRRQEKINASNRGTNSKQEMNPSDFLHTNRKKKSLLSSKRCQGARKYINRAKRKPSEQQKVPKRARRSSNATPFGTRSASVRTLVAPLGHRKWQLRHHIVFYRKRSFLLHPLGGSKNHPKSYTKWDQI